MLESDCPFYPICSRKIRQGIRRCTKDKKECKLFHNYNEMNSYFEDLAQNLDDDGNLIHGD